MTSSTLVPKASRSVAVIAALLACTVWTSAETSAGTLDNVKLRNRLLCGVSDHVPGFAMLEGPDRWSGVEVEFCRAVAAAVLGDVDAIEYRPLSVGEGLRAVASGEVDLLAASAAWTLSRDSEFDVRFVDVLVYDGQGFLTPRTHGLASALELTGATICAVAGTSGVNAVEDYFTRHRMRYQLVTMERWGDLVATYAGGGCTTLSADVTTLASVRTRLDKPTEHALLPEIISKEPRGPVVRTGDDKWFNVVRWVMAALVAAEELQLTRSNVAQRREARQEDIRRLLGAGSNLGQALGLDADWAYRIVRDVGNYGEIFDRTLGAASPLKLARGLNRLWSQGGLMYAPPVR